MCKFLVTAFCLFVASYADADIPCVVNEVASGDEFSCSLIQAGWKQVAVKLQYVTAPKLNQPFGAESKEELERELLFSKVIIDSKVTDNDGRYVSVVFKGNRQINIEHVKKGYAFISHNDLDQADYVDAMIKAKGRKIGIWSNASNMTYFSVEYSPSLERSFIDMFSDNMKKLCLALQDNC